MSEAHASSRARANHELYLAKIVLSAWRRDLDRQLIPAVTLAQAFHDAAREHLAAAYGWFLLAICKLGTASREPPRSFRQLPPLPAGAVFPAEIDELRQLESSGWLGHMLRVPDPQLPAPRRGDNLASSSGNLPSIEQLQHWLEQLEMLFERMGNSLDEY